uniref:Small integral membrane protein 29 n=1 Tax=Salmo trutta TaxID=8032 RepID=A0A674CSW4_SALTR
MNSTTQPPAIIDGDVAVSSVLVPFFLITFIGIAAAVVMYVRRKRRIDRLRHQLLPVYTYDPSEELHEVEQEMLWKEEDTKTILSPDALSLYMCARYKLRVGHVGEKL